MIYGFYNSAAGMLTNEYRQAVLSNNLANADTVGFKREVPVFAERLTAEEAGLRRGPSAPDLASLSGGLWLGRTAVDHEGGAQLKTDNPLDAALAGSGFFAVSAGGRTLYTRDGRFTVNNDGVLASVIDGAEVLDRAGNAIRVNPLGPSPQITRDGRITQDGAVVGDLQIVDFADYDVLAKVGASRFAAPDGATPLDGAADIYSGTIEQSGAKPIHELVELMAASRAYQMNAQMVTLQDQTLGRLIGLISR